MNGSVNEITITMKENNKNKIRNAQKDTEKNSKMQRAFQIVVFYCFHFDVHFQCRRTVIEFMIGMENVILYLIGANHEWHRLKPINCVAMDEKWLE